MLYLTPLYSRPRSDVQYLLKSLALGPWPFRAFRMGRASSYEMGIDGMLGMYGSVGPRGTPGLEGYPGVVLLKGFSLCHELGGMGSTHGSPGAKLKNCVLPRCTLLG